MKPFARLALFLLLAAAARGVAQDTTRTVSDRLTVGSGTLGAADLEVAGKTGWPAAPGLRVNGDGGVLFTGAYGTGLLPTATSTTQSAFVWYPRRAALMIGSNLATADIDVGNHSLAFGDGVRARGTGSVAIGGSTNANFACVIGLNSGASANWSTVLGPYAGASAEGATALSFSNASGPGSYALGGTTYGASAATLGSGLATGNYSTAMGGGTANGTYSTAMGTATATGNYSLAVGPGVGGSGNLTRYCSTVLGAYNAAEGTANTSWVATDPLFTIANGTDDTHRSNALVVYKNGKIKITKRQGDIQMGIYGNGNGD